MTTPRPVLLAIMDGWGLAPAGPGNGVSLANTPNVDHWMATCPTTQLHASGLDVGLPEGQIGNSEVGHLNIGAGLVVYQDSTRISESIKSGEFFENPAFLEAVQIVKERGTNMHLIGLIGRGGVHAYDIHLAGLLQLMAQQGVNRTYIHAFMDGRDTLPQSGLGYMQELQRTIAQIGVGQVASVIGRYYAMDRDKRWERVGAAYAAMVEGVGHTASDPINAIEQSYLRDARGDEFIEATVITDSAGVALPRISAGDVVICFNFRADRVRQITRALMQPDFNTMVQEWYANQAEQGLQLPTTIWQRPEQVPNLHYVTMTQYDATFPYAIAYPPHYITEPLAKVIADAGKRQYHSAETEKYPHVTFFLNGRREEPFAGEDRVMASSPKVATYDLQPEMSAEEVAAKLLDAVNSQVYDFLVVNFANPDMVGHTGVIPAVVKACETVDHCLGQVVPAVVAQGGVAILIADHGNAEQMIDPQTGGPHTAHTTNLVPCILVADPATGLTREHISLRAGGRLADLAPTILDLLGLQKAEAMTGTSLIETK
ncbi:2,3-bisphosphoglycerate-independent phosphoglycerate mutase [Herpetosiphon gulosus]|uniref:2,3-bisphosphoglycerate-independent phosphoglycerate mutase n=1 Tax=Herpetosiphon gulosus TaxID=1973496 RepID=A0ABP9X536_9CHLR